MNAHPHRLPLAAALPAALSAALLLSGCGSRGTGSQAAPPPAAVATPSKSDVLPPMPRLDDPVYSAMLGRVNGEYQRWLANPGAYLPSTAGALPWPCVPPQPARDKLAGIPDARDPKILAAYAKQERAAGMKRGTLKPPGVEDARVHLLKGECVKGALQGEVELLAEYTSVSTVLDNETRIPQRVLKRFVAQGGKPVGLVYTATFHGEHRSSKPSSITVKSLFGSFVLGDTNMPPRNVGISYMRTEAPKPMFGTYVSITQSVTQSVPLKGERWKLVTYNGPTKINEMHFKGEVLHGRSIGYAYEIKSPYSSDPLRIPASETCYDDGEQIKSAACDVD